ncbi:MAG: AFG1 family ATPase [Hoeflea sp.]|uniref:cell division protein ZapE n=1 Tax=Hoeflea sp. TaxID=1940281 RepID=UPI001DE59653|nr:cell division protein ZapE [Hoeflea sp.]MBU4529862.1 AFG1 family ATPase [Alphaproteobacteria bacterium]MBU4547117.1 AFG1 family ATPase [Alphaproteobacteria bacterium]MBU4548730.1 AFG1 family ATPase [Alphaproteobacteria bacterium]MBV1722355.1 AFG1 family ATPase [Hoeflea sp.]MBV1762489.1 AFG1 family ATPase [Hoeflea sp.]
MSWKKLDTVESAYVARVASGEFTEDPAQARLARRLDVLLDEVSSKRLATKSSALGWLFARKGNSSKPPRGLYVHGDVGRGKTVLMDMFYEMVPARRKRRAHFHDFMADAHARIHAHRQKLKSGETSEADPVPPVAEELIKEAWVLCFDEFSVTDIADAMLLSRLFEQLFKRGCVLVATSNVEPSDLYRDGLNRQLFLPFIALLKNHVNILSLDARTDYRMETTARLPVYHLLGGAEDEGEDAMDRAWERVTAGKLSAPEQLRVRGRDVAVPLAGAGAARFSFADLCEAPLGAADYAAIAARYHTVFVDRAPVMGQAGRNAAKRFIILIDTLYDRKTRLFISAAAEPDALYQGSSGTESFEFARTASRLNEMQGAAYLEASRAGQASTVSETRQEL